MKYDEIIEEIKSSFDTKDSGIPIPSFPIYNDVVGNIVPGTFTVIGGLPGAGKTSFMDQNYVLNPLYRWYRAEDGHVPDVKVLYFSFKNNKNIKIKTFLCNYAMTFSQLRLDVNTLISSKNRRFDLDDSELGLNVLENSKGFFNAVLDNRMLQIFDGEFSPEDMYNQATDSLSEMGKFNKNGVYIPYGENTHIIIAIDNADLLVENNEIAGKVYKGDLRKQMLKYIALLMKKYNVTIVANVLIDRFKIFKKSETIPNYAQLEEWGTAADIGAIIYSPNLEGTAGVLLNGENPETYIVRNVDYLRYWFVVKNNMGPEFAKCRFLFMGGSSYGVEVQDDENNVIKGKADISKYLFADYSLY